MMKICLILGTRPEIIKMASILRVLKKRKINHFILHTGQHYSSNMDDIFFQELGLSPPKNKLSIGSKFNSELLDVEMIDIYQLSEMIKQIGKILVTEKPDVVLVQGDTNTALAGTLASIKKRIKTGHVESGLRSHDKTMPEEINRIMIDHISDLLFAPTSYAQRNLIKEGIDKNVIHIVGNTIVDNVYQCFALAKEKSNIMEKLCLLSGEYILTTFHRQENVDDKKRLENLITILENINHTIVFPIHPRTQNRLIQFKLNNRINKIKKLKIIDPLGYLDFLMLLSNSKMVMTDSGGIQEEATVLKIPCITLRDNTERQESVEAGGNLILGVDPKNVLPLVNKILHDECFRKKIQPTKNPFGDGKSAEKIVDILLSEN